MRNTIESGKLESRFGDRKSAKIFRRLPDFTCFGQGGGLGIVIVVGKSDVSVFEIGVRREATGVSEEKTCL
jgi:hypothetical protein